MTDAKTTYAQSSDIKSRTYLEYRKDMKQKAIAELEILQWLKNKLSKENKKIIVQKFDGDSQLWFLRKGGITREPDFVITHPDKREEYLEFQYSKEELTNYDFKISKITPKRKSLQKENKKILYLIKPIAQYAMLDLEWIAKQGVKTVAAAWGNAPVYRVPSNAFTKLLTKDKSLFGVCSIIDKKMEILNFQHDLIDVSKNQLSYLLQKVIDEKQIVKIMPNTLEGFFKVCFILDNLQKIPENANLWLVYLLSYANQKLNSHDLFQLIYCLDFLYSKTELKKNELDLVVKALNNILKKINSFATNNGSYCSDKTISPLDDTKYCLFCINLIEDLTQDLLFYYGNDLDLEPIKVIYQNVKDINKTHSFIFSKN